MIQLQKKTMKWAMRRKTEFTLNERVTEQSVKHEIVEERTTNYLKPNAKNEIKKNVDWIRVIT